MKKNIVLIGMPASGKSTVGVLLAKRLNMAFVDTDIYIQTRTGTPLASLLDPQDPEPFRKLEQEHLLTLDITGHVIATGGSVIYGESAMEHLRANAIVAYLYTPLALLEMRITDLVARAVAIRPTQTLSDLFEERHPLYTRYANIIVDCMGKDHEAVVAELKQQLPAI